MKKYAYFPGCSLEKMALSYHKSSLETTKALGVELEELDDWNCCGATTYFHLDEILANTLVARNLAIAEKEGLDFVAPCSACYKNAYFTNTYMKEDEDLAEHINFALEADDLQLEGNMTVHHLIDIFANEIGADGIKEKVSVPLEGLRIAPYYGCQIVLHERMAKKLKRLNSLKRYSLRWAQKPLITPTRPAVVADRFCSQIARRRSI